MPNRTPEVVVEDRRRGWSEKVVSWGHMLIALIAMVSSFGAYIITTEKRITQLEERYLQLAKRNEEQDSAVAGMLQNRNVQMNNVMTKLDAIAADVVLLKIQSGVMQQQLQRGGRF